MKIKNFFKFFGSSFFSDKSASEAPKHGFTTVGFSLLLSFLFFICSYMAAGILPFATHYGNAGSYNEFINSAFSQIELTVKDRAAISDKRINTYLADSDADDYKLNGYNLIVDTRSSRTLVEFTQVAIKDGAEIDYELYLSLADSEKEEYKLETRYTDKELKLTDEMVARYSAFLNGAGDEAKAALNSLDKEALRERYNEEVYFLYVRYYYSGVSSMLYGAKAPVLRDYYYRNYIKDSNAYYFYLFDDMCAGSFKTDGGLPVVFGGYFKNTADGRVEDIGKLIKDAYYDSAGYSFTSYFVGTMSQLPLLIFIPIILGFLMWAINKTVRDGWDKTFAGCYKIVNSFVWVSAFIVALITFALGFFISKRLVYMLMLPLFALVIAVRAAVFCITTTVKNRKKPVSMQNNKDIFGDIL